MRVCCDSVNIVTKNSTHTALVIHLADFSYKIFTWWRTIRQSWRSSTYNTSTRCLIFFSLHLCKPKLPRSYCSIQVYRYNDEGVCERSHDFLWWCERWIVWGHICVCSSWLTREEVKGELVIACVWTGCATWQSLSSLISTIIISIVVWSVQRNGHWMKRLLR